MTEARTPTAAELQARYQGVVKMILNHPQKETVQKRVTAHLRAITDNKLFSIAMYHVAASVPAADKWELYTLLASALTSNDWSKLQGQLGNGAASVAPANQDENTPPSDPAETRYRALVKIISSIGGEAQSRVDVHILTVTDGEHEDLES